MAQTQAPSSTIEQCNALVPYLKAIGIEEEYDNFTVLEMVSLNYEVRELIMNTVKK